MRIHRMKWWFCAFVSVMVGALSVSANEPDQAAELHKHLVIYDFSEHAEHKQWEVEDDVVMGGRSEGGFTVNEAGNALFSGNVSLENDGGFSSIQSYFSPIDVSAYTSAVIRLKGDKKKYQFRVESVPNERHSYIYVFETTGEWQDVVIPFSEMYAEFRGDRLDLPNYPGKTMSHVRFLIANGRQESFELEVDRIWLQ